MNANDIAQLIQPEIARTFAADGWTAIQPDEMTSTDRSVTICLEAVADNHTMNLYAARLQTRFMDLLGRKDFRVLYVDNGDRCGYMLLFDVALQPSALPSPASTPSTIPRPTEAERLAYLRDCSVLAAKRHDETFTMLSQTLERINHERE